MSEVNLESDCVSENPELSAIISCYYEEKSIDEFYERLSKSLNSTKRSYEIIFVNDGSTDRTFEKQKQIFEKDAHVRVIIDFFKNAGQSAAMTAASIYARGKILFFSDSDLQLDPMELNLLLTEFDKGYDVVSGYRKSRKDSLLRILDSCIISK